jgi:hypothetical protein
MLLRGTLIAFAAMLVQTAPSVADSGSLIHQAQFRGPGSGQCPHGYDFNDRDGRCYQHGAGRDYRGEGRMYRGGQYPVRSWRHPGNIEQHGAGRDYRGEGRMYRGGRYPVRSWRHPGNIEQP